VAGDHSNHSDESAPVALATSSRPSGLASATSQSPGASMSSSTFPVASS
jgi:hypothetical protein